MKLILSKFFKNGHFPLIRTSYELSNKYVINSLPSISFTRNNDERLVYYKSIFYHAFNFNDNMLKKRRKNYSMMTTCIKEALMQTIYLIK